MADLFALGDEELEELICVCAATNPWHGSSKLLPGDVDVLREEQVGMHTDIYTDIVKKIQEFEDDQKCLMREREGVISKVVIDRHLKRLKEMPKMEEGNLILNFLRAADYMNAQGCRLITVEEYRHGMNQVDDGEFFFAGFGNVGIQRCWHYIKRNRN